MDVFAVDFVLEFLVAGVCYILLCLWLKMPSVRRPVGFACNILMAITEVSIVPFFFFFFLIDADSFQLRGIVYRKS